MSKSSSPGKEVQKYSTEKEMKLLLDILEEYKDLVCTRKNDVDTIARKHGAWTSITKRYNAVAVKRRYPKKSYQQLKRTWEHMKTKAKKIYLQDKKNKNSAEIGLQNHHGSHTPTQLSRPDSQQQGKGTQKPGRGSKSRKKPTTCQVLPLTNPFDSDAPSDCEMEDAPPPNPPPAEQLAPTPEPPVCTPPETRPPSATLSTTSTAGSMLPPEVPASPAPPSLDGQEEALPSLDGEEEALLLLDGQEDAQPSLDGQEDLRPTSPEDVLSVPPSESSPPPQQPPKRKRSDNASVPEQRSEDVMDLKYKEHELDMEIKRTEQECAIMEKELKQLNLEMVKMDSEVKRVELKVLNLSLKNKEIQTQTFQNELQNSKKMSRVLDVWENTAVTVQTAASGIIEYLNHLKS